MTRRYKHDLFVHELVREISSAPEAMHREFRLSDEVRLPQIFDKQTEADLRALLTLEDIPRREAVAILRRGVDQWRAADTMLRTMLKFHTIFQDLAFTREQIESRY